MDESQEYLLSLYRGFRESMEFTERPSLKQMEILATAVLCEKMGVPNEESDKEIMEQHSIQIIYKRMDALLLPIRLTPDAFLSTLAFSENNPGKALVILIDALNEYEGKTVTSEMIANMYPNGFYKEEVWAKYVDEVIVKRKIKWAHIY